MTCDVIMRLALLIHFGSSSVVILSYIDEYKTFSVVVNHDSGLFHNMIPYDKQCMLCLTCVFFKLY